MDRFRRRHPDRDGRLVCIATHGAIRRGGTRRVRAEGRPGIARLIAELAQMADTLPEKVARSGFPAESVGR